ncbi:MAG TPA: hypothetical protein PK677_12605 [Acidiphilium sp.]|nr:MAG: hypothetical protein B7Z67_11115 [Acidiphilium sp. 21-60-14]OYV90187.1 MAG: hypothetical protein B7Z57_09740 [Acidiphilium sp. 37-60-79]OZB41214.1 MAG: hypothetical protein B7X48_00715 [Acidiphilium sp. 34-60-192]HQT89378.1 hypothetical protein [Acidiphilium sp.]HQU25039.1 hypothetical protein [Acidiphilium sp.]
MSEVERAIDGSVRYLGSTLAIEALRESPYWPKWDQPWWHMLLLHEMGETARIPPVIVRAFVEALNATPVQIFPIWPGEAPEGADPYRDWACHCQLGNVYRVLDASGVDMDAELPWVGTWFLQYQMADGGLNCDEAAYRIENECPSSMVGTIAAFEALTLHTRRPWNAAEQKFLDAAAHFMIERRLVLGSPTTHNAAERIAAQDWGLLCFPRFYQYDVLRGLTALVNWAERSGWGVPREVVAPILADLERRFPDGVVQTERYSCDEHGTITRLADGIWDHTRRPSSSFPLLDLVRTRNMVSPYLSLEFAQTKQRLQNLMRL